MAYAPTFGDKSTLVSTDTTLSTVATHGNERHTSTFLTVSGLPTASASTLGCIKLGTGLTDVGGGVIDVTGGTPGIHNLVDTVNHPVSGLTEGHFLKATGATTYGFAAHGITLGDLGGIADPGTSVDRDIVVWNGTTGDAVYGESLVSISALGHLSADGDVIAYQAGSPSSDFWDDMPKATETTMGGFKFYPTQFEWTGTGNDQLKVKDSVLVPADHTHDWEDLVTGVPTTIAGYGITDGVVYTGTPLDNQIAIWTPEGDTIEGSSNLRFDGTNLLIGSSSVSDRLLSIYDNTTGNVTQMEIKNASSTGRALFSLSNDSTGLLGFLMGGTAWAAPAYYNTAWFTTAGTVASFNICTNSDVATGGTTPIKFIAGGYNVTPQLMINPTVSVDITANTKLKVDHIEEYTGSHGVVFDSNLVINTTGSYLTAGGNNSVRIQTASGYVDLGPQNTTYCHFGTDRGTYYFDHAATLSGHFYPFSTNTYTLGTASKLWNIIYGNQAIFNSVGIGATPTTALHIEASQNSDLTAYVYNSNTQSAARATLYLRSATAGLTLAAKYYDSSTSIVAGTGETLMIGANDTTTGAITIDTSNNVTIPVKLILTTGLIDSSVADGALSEGFTFTTPAYSTSGAKLISVVNNTTEKLYVDKDGTSVSQGDFVAYASGYSGITGYTFRYSLTADGSYNVNLVNDASTPGPNKVYGTDGDGVRGWITAPTTMTYPGAGIPISTGSAWDTSITNNSANWNTAYGWGDHAGLYQTVHANLTSLSGLTYASASFVKMTAAGTFSLDTDTYSLSGHTHTNMVDYTGSTADNQIAVFTDTNTIEGTANLTYASGLLTVTSTSTPGLRLAGTGSNQGIQMAAATGKYNFLIGLQYNVDNTFEITPSTAAEGFTFTTPAIAVKHTGEVGIGISSPAYKLDACGTTSTNIDFRVANTYWNREIITGVNTSSIPYIQGRITNTSAVHSLLINPDGGNVGIGTTSSTYRTTIHRGAADSAFAADTYSTWVATEITANAGAQYAATGILFTPEFGGGKGAGIVAIDPQVGSWGGVADLAFVTASGNTSYERMRIKADGKIKIGTGDPAHELDVTGTIVATGDVIAYHS